MKFALIIATLVVCAYADSSSSEQGPTGKGCSCGKNTRENPCNGNVGTNNIGCSNSNKFVTCTATACVNQTCQAGEVWNSTQKQCASCEIGFQVSTDGQVCVCQEGTTPTGQYTCGPCPKNANITADSCYCTSPLVRNRAANVCQLCPTNSTLLGGNCKCNATLFWNAAAWECLPCPGTWVPEGSGRRITSVCTCPASTIFNEDTVTCDTCPLGTAPDDDGDSCDCPIDDQYYNATIQACQCPPNKPLNSAGKCKYVAPVAPAAGRRRRHI